MSSKDKDKEPQMDIQTLITGSDKPSILIRNQLLKALKSQQQMINQLKSRKITPENERFLRNKK